MTDGEENNDDVDVRKQLDVLMASKHRPAKLLFMLTPPTDAYSNTGVNASMMRLRNAKDVEYFQRVMEKHPDGSVYMIPSHDMATTSPWNPVDGGHYQCIDRTPLHTQDSFDAFGLWRENATERERREGGARQGLRQNLAKGGSCWDPWNTALVQHVLNIACLT
jgi:hypothetical protein